MVNELNELKAKQHQSHNNADDEKAIAEKIDSLRRSLNESGLMPDREGLSERAIYLEVGPEGVMKLIEVTAEVQDANDPDTPSKLDELTKKLGIEEAFDVAKLKLAIKDIKRLAPFMAARCVKLQRKKRLTGTEKDEYNVLCANLIHKFGINPNEADAVQWALIAHNERTVQRALNSIDKKTKSVKTQRFSPAAYQDGNTNEPEASAHKGTKPPRDCQLVVRGKRHREAEMPVNLRYLGISITNPDELRRILKALEKQQKKLDTERHSAPTSEYSSSNEAADLTRAERQLIKHNPDWIAIALGEAPDGNVAAKRLTRDQIGLMYHNPDWRRIARSEAIRKKAEALREEEAVG